MTKLQEQAVADPEAGRATGMCPHVSHATLRRAAEARTVERMELSLVKEERNYQNEQDSEPERSKVYLYWDESAHLKQRPWNERAMQLLSTTTTTTTTIHANGTMTGDGGGILGDGRMGGSSMSNIYGNAFLIRFTSPQQQLLQQQLPTLEDAISNLPTRQNQIISLSRQEIESNL
jgi:hypothetical protein